MDSNNWVVALLEVVRTFLALGIGISVIIAKLGSWEKAPYYKPTPLRINFSLFCIASLLDVCSSIGRNIVAINVYFGCNLLLLHSIFTHNDQPKWYRYLGYGGCWSLMMAFELISLTQYLLEATLVASSPRLDTQLVCRLATVGLKTLSLPIVIWLDLFRSRAQPGYTAVPQEDIEAPQQRDTTSDPTHIPVKEEIQQCGGLWNWVWKFKIFLPWTLPLGTLGLRVNLCVVLLSDYVTVALSLYQPILYGSFIQSLGQAASEKDMGPIWRSLMKYIGFELAERTITIARNSCWNQLAMERNSKRDEAIYSHIMSLPASYHERQNASDTLQDLSLGVEVITSFDFLIFGVLPTLLQLAGVIGALITMYPVSSFLVAFYMILVEALLNESRTKMLLPRRETYNETSKRRYRHLYHLPKWKVAARHNNIANEVGKHGQVVMDLRTQRRSLWILQTVFSELLTVCFQFGEWFALILVTHALVTTGDVEIQAAIVTFNAYFNTILTSVQTFVELPNELIETFSQAAPLRRILELPPDNWKGTTQLDARPHDVVIDRLAFAIGDRTLFNDLSLLFQQGQVTGILGKSGLGKSMLFDIITGFRAPQSGSVTIGGTDITTITQQSLRESVGILPQSVEQHLFDYSIMENVRYACPGASDEEVMEACRKAGVHDAIERQEEGYFAKAMSLSGGERQRVVLARVFLCSPPIILLDEPTSALDQETANYIMESVRKGFSGKTIVIITHEQALLSFFDHVYVLGQGGKVVQSGTPESLEKDENGVVKQNWK